jgi:tryptophanyl-tRNA synthetase
VVLASTTISNDSGGFAAALAWIGEHAPDRGSSWSIARRFNDRYAAGAGVFFPPDALLTRAPALLGTDGTKMSKSRRNTIDLCASEDQTAQLLRRAKTDAERNITY